MKTGGSPKKSPNDWLAEMMGAIEPDVVPPGWLTLQQMSDQSGASSSTLRGRLDTLIAQGKIKRKQFRIRRANGILAVWHYAPEN